MGLLQVNLPHFRDSFEDADKDGDNRFGSLPSEDNLCNSEGYKLTEFCERNTFDILNGKYG
jgi:hypothetical protein